MIKISALPRSIYPKSRKDDINDAVLNSVYDEKRKKIKEKKRKSEQKKMNYEKVKERVLDLRKFILEIDPTLEKHLGFFRECYSFLKDLGLIGE